MSDDDPDERRYGPIIIFLVVFGLLIWAFALHLVGGH
jgi:hypothetical protein